MSVIFAGESKKTVGQIYHLSPERPISWGELAKIALKILDKRGFNISVPLPLIKCATFISELTGKITGSNPALNWERYEQMKPDFWVSSSQKAKRDFGFIAKTRIEDSVKETLEWYVKQGWL